MNEQLLIRFLTHRCTSEEIKQMDGWIAAEKANAEWLFEMERIWSLKDELRFSDKREIEAAYIRFIANNDRIDKTMVNKSVSQRFYISSVMKYAGVVIFLILMSLNLYKMSDKQPDSVNIVDVPNGQRVALTLSDGTKVWLNSSSKFTYPTQFSAKSREVGLDGEAFFEVVHDKKSPFIVNGSLVNIKVIGTKFNMKAYSDESAIITLAEGKVEVASNDNENKITLKPNEQVSYSKEAGMSLSKNIDTSTIRSWIAGEAAFINKRLDEIVHDLDRKFNVTINIQDQALEEELFTCRFKESTTIEQVLALLRETRKLDYSIDGHQIQIFKPKNNMPMREL